jgi:hypothetical protein
MPWFRGSLRSSAPVAALTAAAIALTACGPAAQPTSTEAPPPVAESPTATLEPSPVAGPSFEAVSYRDEVAGFEFDHPASWFVGPVEQYSRGGITAFTSWERPTDLLPGETPPGETRLDVAVQLWDPTGDLEAFVQQRRGAWDASGISVVSQEEWSLEDGRPARAFVVAGADGAQAYFFFTTIGDRYLVLSGDGDLALLAEIARTVRPIPFSY